MTTRIFSALVVIAAISGFPALADEPPSTQDIVDALLPTGLDGRQVRGARSIAGALGGERGITVTGGEREIPSIDLRVAFEFDSAVLSNDAMLTLQRLGDALTNEAFSDSRFRIIGHTDARGTYEYNDDLSLRRAGAVVSYLHSNFGLAAERLEVEGRGKHQLIEGIPPEDERNRRVEIRNLGAVE